MSLFEENSTLRILQHFGDVVMDNFSERLRLQKLAFLSESLGAAGGFNFTYYHYGPYSPILTKLLYKGVSTRSFNNSLNYSEQEQQIIDKINELLGDSVNDSNALELFASVWYLFPSREITDQDRHFIIQTIIETKPIFSKNEVRMTIDRIVMFKQHHHI